MNDWLKILAVSSMCACSFTVTSLASTNLETGSSLAGISVALNNYYAGNTEPEKQLASIYPAIGTTATGSAASGETQTAQSAASGDAKTAQGAASGETKAAQSAASGEGQAAQGAAAGKAQVASRTKAAEKGKSQTTAYDNIAVSKVNGSVNIRTAANTTSSVTGKIYNDSAATILDTVDGEGGKWYKIQSGSVTGYIKAGYFVTGQQAEARAKVVGTTYGTIAGTPSLRLRATPNMEGKTLTLLSEGAHYVVTGQEGDFLKVSVDSDLEGYVFKDYMKTNVEFNKAVSVEEEKAREAENAKRKEDAQKALKVLEEAKQKEAAKSTAAAETKAQKTTKAAANESKKAETKGTNPAVQTIAANPEKGYDSTVAAPGTEKAPEGNDSKGPGAKGPGPSGPSSQEVVSATRNAVVAYAKQFLGNPYIYGGTSLTSGADCSGFIQGIFSHFGITTGRSSRDQAARGRTISVSEAKPGDLLFYASGDYINHVALYIGGGQVLHASNPATGICISPANYRTPCKAVTFLD